MPHATKVDITWFDDDGDLTELDSSDESDEEPPAPPPKSAARRETKAVPDFTPALKRVKETRPTTQNATEKSRVRGGLNNVVPCLKPPRTTNYSAQSLFDWIEEGLVELNPEYQRSVVWNEAKQTALIGSLFSNYYVPPIVFTVKRQDDGTEVRVCIDGKQRLTSIHRFMKGEIANKDVVTNRKSYFKNQPGSKRKLISDALRGVFKNKQITCVEYEDLTGEQEREIFQRVQLGVSLSPADRLPAINGPHADLVRQLRRQIEETASFEVYFEWGTARGKDFQALAQFVYLLKFSPQSKNIEPTTTRLEKFLSAQAPESELKKLEELAMRVMRIYCRIAREYGEHLRKNLMPLEFVMSCFLISTHRKRLTDAQLSHAIGLMRSTFAKGDKKTSTKSFKLLLSFILKDVPKLAHQLSYDPADTQMADDKTDREQASYATSQFTHLDTDSTNDLTKGKAAKRKLPESDNEDYILPKKIKHKTEAQTTPPLESNSSISKVSKVDIPKSRLSLTARAGAAKTTVKARKVSDKIPPDSQTATPSVRPAPSLRTGTTTMSAVTKKKTAVTSSSAVAAIPSPRIPLPTRSCTITSNSMNAASCSQPQLQSASTQEVSHSRVPPQISPADRLPSRGGESVPPNPPLSTGGLQATVNATGDRLAPQRIVKAAMAQDTGAYNGAVRAVSTSVASSHKPPVIVGQPQQRPGGSAGQGQARRSSLPHFKKSRTSPPEPSGSVGMDTSWEEGLGTIMQSISAHEAPQVASGMSIEGLSAAWRDSAGNARPQLASQLHQLQVSIPSGMTMGPGPGSAGSSNAPSGTTLMTPTTSPSIPQSVMQNQPQAATRDPRKVKREQEVATRAAHAQGQLGQTHPPQASVQVPAPPYAPAQAHRTQTTHLGMQQQQMLGQQRQQHLQMQVSAQQQFPPAAALQQAHMQQFRKQQEQQRQLQQKTHNQQTRQAPTPSPSISPHQQI